MSQANPALRSSFVEIVGADHVLESEDLVGPYVTDWTRRFVGSTPYVVRPGTGREVEAVVELCRRNGVAIVPQGGNTGLVGGSVPLHGEVLLSLRRLDGLGPVDAAAGQVTAGTGVTVGALQRAATAAGWEYGIDLASRDSATVGGTIATNAGGLHVLRHGDTRAQVLGTECVLGTGRTVAHLGGLLKDNTGYALPSLFCGSEGTLGVLTAARLRLVPPAPERVVAVAGFGLLREAVEAAGHLRRGLSDLAAVELFLEGGLQLVCGVLGLLRPFESPAAAYLLVECAGPRDPTAELAEALAATPGIRDVAVASEPSRRAALWRYREAHTEAIATRGVVHKLDVTLPAGVLAEFMTRVAGEVRAVAGGAEVWLFGHAADGNVHVNITGVSADDDRPDDAVLRLVASYGGSISAEHGIGTAKRRWIGLNRTESELEAFRAIKRALDPDGILNPHVLFPS